MRVPGQSWAKKFIDHDHLLHLRIKAFECLEAFRFHPKKRRILTRHCVPQFVDIIEQFRRFKVLGKIYCNMSDECSNLQLDLLFVSGGVRGFHQASSDSNIITVIIFIFRTLSCAKKAKIRVIKVCRLFQYYWWSLFTVFFRCIRPRNVTLYITTHDYVAVGFRQEVKPLESFDRLKHVCQLNRNITC